MDKWQLIEKAKMAEQMERYDDMTSYMKQVVEQGEYLDMSERNLLSVAYKNKVGALRSACRIISAVDPVKDKVKPENLKAYLEKIGEELTDVTEQVLGLLDDHLLKNNKDTESQVFFLKMKGDYYRYRAEVASDDQDNTTRLSQSAYSDALAASDSMAATHPIRLGLILNFSVFFYEILNKPEEALTLAQKGFDDAIAQLDENDSSYKDSTLILQLLRDNITLWTGETDRPGE